MDMSFIRSSVPEMFLVDSRGTPIQVSVKERTEILVRFIDTSGIVLILFQAPFVGRE